MKVKDIVYEDFINYKKPSMFILFPSCNFKCCNEFGSNICQNSKLANMDTIDISDDTVIDKYVQNTITKAIVFGGLEPFDSFGELLEFLNKFRKKSNDDIVIYTGYKEEEIKSQITILSTYSNIIVKFGRYIPDTANRFDEVLGVTLVSDNQYAKSISIR